MPGGGGGIEEEEARVPTRLFRGRRRRSRPDPGRPLRGTGPLFRLGGRLARVRAGRRRALLRTGERVKRETGFVSGGRVVARTKNASGGIENFKNFQPTV